VPDNSAKMSAPAPAVSQDVVITDFNITDEDLNGECFIVGAEGEIEELVEKNEVIFLPDTPAAGPADVRKAIPFDAGQANTFLAANMVHSVSAGRSVRDAAIIAYIRLLAARNGLISPDFSPAAHNVRYNHAVRVDAAAKADLLKRYAGDSSMKSAATTVLTPDVRKRCRTLFSDIVCCVAYIFRVRGHHYRDDINDRYTSLWERCLHRSNDLPLSWELLATDSLHAIMPDVLDDYWRDCVDNSRCAGALIKRFDSAPAGVAGVVALQRGLDDVRMLFPQITDQVRDAYDEFTRVVDMVRNSRWGGSINCRFYGAPRIRVDEGRIGSLASVVMGVYDQLAPDSKLRESPALKRLAQTAPATGGAIGLAARRTVQSEQMLLIGHTAGYQQNVGN